jgi:hypothetical protein
VNRVFWTTVGRGFRRMALPLAAYYAITLGLPLANGAARAGAAFVEHAVIVLVVPPAMIMFASALFLPQGAQGIDAAGADGGDQRGGERGECERRGGGGDR